MLLLLLLIYILLLILFLFLHLPLLLLLPLPLLLLQPPVDSLAGPEQEHGGHRLDLVLHAHLRHLLGGQLVKGGLQAPVSELSGVEPHLAL